MKVGSEATDKKFKAKDNYTTTLQPLNTSSTKGKFSPNHRGIGILKGTQSYEIFAGKSSITHNTSTVTAGHESSILDGGPSLFIANHEVSTSIMSKGSPAHRPIIKSSLKDISKTMHDQSLMSIASDDMTKLNTRNLPIGIQTRQKQLTQYLQKEAIHILAQQNTNYVQAAGNNLRKFNNSSSMTATRGNPAYDTMKYSHLEPSHILGDYNSVAVLPVIGNEINLDMTAKRQFSKVELSKKDMQNFLVNGSISKQFIQSNKKELQKFIKSYNRSESQHGFFKGYTEIDSISKALHRSNAEEIGGAELNETVLDLGNSKRGTSVDKTSETIKLKNSKIFGKTHQNSVTKRKDKSMSPNGEKGFVKQQTSHQQPEKGFHGETSSINNRVLETWINETLTDAQHLDIPGVILKPEFKNPINRYGIDRFTLTNSGMSSDEVDRIYRCLFVYSVGFFEMLKSVLAQTEKNFQIVTAIWKVFQVLLEYCCKTDYKIMMAEISTKYQESLEKLLQENLQRIQSYIETERLLKQNIETMQNYQDKLEKDKQNEKQLRLKLEEEYMQNTKNHEEEVKLRLKFESKLNKLYQDHRELIIKYDRCQAELFLSQSLNNKMEKQYKDAQDDLAQEKQKTTDQQFRILDLQEWKELNTKDLKLKTMRLKNAEQMHGEVKEEKEFAHYNVQDAKQELERCKKKLEQLTTDNSILKSDLEREIIMEKDATAKMIKFEGLYNDLKSQFDQTVADKDKLYEESQSLNMQVQEQQDLIDDFRKNENKLKQKALTLEASNTQLKYDFETILLYKNSATAEVETTVQQLRKMNEERHKTILALENKTDECIQLQNNLVVANNKIKEQEQDIQERNHTIELYTIDLRLAHDTIKANNLSSTQQVTDLQKNLKEINQFYKDTRDEVDQWQKKYNQQVTLLNLEKNKVWDLESQVRNLTVSRDSFEHMFQASIAKIGMLEGNLTTLKHKLEESEAAMNAALLMQRTLEEQIKTQQRMMGEQKVMFDQQLATVYNKMELELERAIMCGEDIMSGSIELKNYVQKLEVQRVELLQQKKRKEFLEISIKEAGEIMEQNAVTIKTKETYLQKITQEFSEAKYEFEQQIKKDTKSHSLQVNELEQKITQDSISYQQKLKKLMDECQQVRKELTECKINLKNAQNKKGVTVKGSKNATNNNETQTKDKATQTLKQKGQVQMKESRIDRLSMGKRSDTNTGSLRDSENDGDKNASEKKSQNLKIEGGGRNISSKKIKKNFSKNNSNDGTSQNIINQDSSDEERAFIDDQQYDSEDEKEFSDLGEEDVEEIEQQEKQKEETPQQKQKRLYEAFKEWLLQNELRLLKKVKYMVLNGIEVNPKLIADMRKQATIPTNLRNIKLTDEQHDELQIAQEEQTQKFRQDLLNKVDYEDQDVELITDRVLQEEVLQYKRRLQSGPNQQLLTSQTNSSIYPVDGKPELTHYSLSASGGVTNAAQNQSNKDEHGVYLTAEDSTKLFQDHSPIHKELAGASSVRVIKQHEPSPSYNKKVFIDSEQVSIMNQNHISGIEESDGAYLPRINKFDIIESEVKRTYSYMQTQSDQLQDPGQHTQEEVQDPVKQAAEKKRNQREAFSKQFGNLYSNFGINNKLLLNSMLEEQKDRLFFRAKELAAKRVYNPIVKNKKVGKYYLIEQKEAENKRIKHIQNFLSELRIQEEKQKNRKSDEDKEQAKIDDEKLQREIAQAQKRLERMQRTVIIREDLIKQQELEERQMLIEQQQAEYLEQEQQQKMLSLIKSRDSGREQENLIPFQDELNANRIDHSIEISNSGEIVAKHRSIVLNKVNNKSDHVSQAEFDEGVNINDEILNASKLANELSPIRILNDRLGNDLLQLQNSDHFEHIEAFMAGGVAALNRKQISKKKTEEANDQIRRERNESSGERIEENKKLGASTIRTLIRAVDSRKN